MADDRMPGSPSVRRNGHVNVHRQGARPRLRHTMCYSYWPSAVHPLPSPQKTLVPACGPSLSSGSSPGQPHKKRRDAYSCPPPFDQPTLQVPNRSFQRFWNTQMFHEFLTAVLP